MTSQRFSSAALFALALAIALVLAPRTIANAQSQQAASGRGLEGTWRVEVTLRDCNTGAPLGSPFRSLLSFARGGTMTETTARFSPALRGPGHGIWQQIQRSTFSSTLEAFLYNPAGVWIEWQRLTQTIEIGDDPNTWTANAHNEIFDTNDNLVIAAVPLLSDTHVPRQRKWDTVRPEVRLTRFSSPENGSRWRRQRGPASPHLAGWGAGAGSLLRRP